MGVQQLLSRPHAFVSVHNAELVGGCVGQAELQSGELIVLEFFLGQDGEAGVVGGVEPELVLVVGREGEGEPGEFVRDVLFGHRAELFVRQLQLVEERDVELAGQLHLEVLAALEHPHHYAVLEGEGF